MSRSHNYALFLIIGTCLLSTSCQRDNFEEPQIIPKTYSFSIPNRISFNFSQLSESRESIIPYSNTLTVQNISNNAFSGEYAIFSFSEVLQNFNTLNFIERGSFSEISTNNSTDSIALEKSDNLFTDNNLIASILNFNDSQSDHNLNGFYTGELNVFSSSDDQLTFVRSVTCTGIIDFEGQFLFLTNNTNEDNVVQLKGSFNSNNLINGNIFDRSANNLSAVMNFENDPFSLNIDNLTGSILFTENTEQRILQFNLTRQN